MFLVLVLLSFGFTHEFFFEQIYKPLYLFQLLTVTILFKETYETLGAIIICTTGFAFLANLLQRGVIGKAISSFTKFNHKELRVIRESQC